MGASSIFTELRIEERPMGRNSITKRLREQNRAEKAERKVAKRQERKVQQSKLPVDSAGDRIEPPALARQGSD